MSPSILQDFYEMANRKHFRDEVLSKFSINALEEMLLEANHPGVSKSIIEEMQHRKAITLH